MAHPDFGRFEVTLHIYEAVFLSDLTNRLLNMLNVAFLHSGIEVNGREYTFDNQGAHWATPRVMRRALETRFRYRESVALGWFEGNMNELNGAINEVHANFGPGTYQVTTKNCNHYCDVMAQRLAGRGIPAHVNRLAAVAATFWGGQSLLADMESAGNPRPSRSTERKELTAEQRALLAKIRTTG